MSTTLDRREEKSSSPSQVPRLPMPANMGHRKIEIDQSFPELYFAGEMWATHPRLDEMNEPGNPIH